MTRYFSSNLLITTGSYILRVMEPVKIDRKWLEEFSTVKTWIRRISENSTNGSLSPNHKSNYYSALRNFLIFLNSKTELDQVITPDGIIEYAELMGPDSVMTLLSGFEKWLQGTKLEGYSRRELKRANAKYLKPNSAFITTHGVVRGFFTNNRIWLPKKKGSAGTLPATKKSDLKYAIFKLDNDIGRVVPDYTQFRFLLSKLNFRDQTVALCLVSTSQDIGDLLKLQIKFVTEQEGRDRLFWEAQRNKTLEHFRTFFSREATKYLRQYISRERVGAKPDELIFLTTGGRELKSTNISEQFRIASLKIGIVWSEAQNPFRPKRMRSIFSSACYQAKIDDGARHIFMGHSGSVSESYREMPVANLEQVYVQIESYITIYSEDNTAELIETKQKSQQALDLALDLREKNKKLEEDVVTLKEMVLGLNTLVTELDKQMNEFRDSYQSE